MLESNVVRASGQTLNPHPTETTSAAPSHIDKLETPPAKRRCLHNSLMDKLTFEYQRSQWEAMKKTINDQVKEVKKLNKSDLRMIVRALFRENIIRGRGLLASAIIKAQLRSPSYAPIYAALVSVINTKLPLIGELICKRVISSWRESYISHDEEKCFAMIIFLAHLINQKLITEKFAFELLNLVLGNYTDNSVKLAVIFLRYSGQKLLKVSPQELDSVFSRLENLRYESSLNKHTQDMIEELFDVRRDEFKAYPAIESGLDFVHENDQYTHMFQLFDSCDLETIIDEFKYDDKYGIDEYIYEKIRKTIPDIDSDIDFESSSNSSDSDEEDDTNEEQQQQTITDQTETNLVTLHHKTCLTIQTNIDARECAHKLLIMNVRHTRNWELCQLIVDICAQQSTYEPFFGLLGRHICLEGGYVYWFECIFEDVCSISHPFRDVQSRNVAKFFAHLLATDSISWSVFRHIRLSKINTTSSLRIYWKNLFLGLFEFLGFTELKNRLTDPTSTEFFQGLFLYDSPENARFCMNFFTSIGLGRITDELREFIQ